jgi:hypothetical protein
MNPQAHLSRVENLLDEALQDLTSLKREAPAARCAAALAEASAELRAFSQARYDLGSQHPDLRSQLGRLPTKLRGLERLLASAAEFYRGWCAAGPPAADYQSTGYSGEGYQSFGWSNDSGPALLAFRG